jgi:hypothetical protein
VLIKKFLGSAIAARNFIGATPYPKPHLNPHLEKLYADCAMNSVPTISQPVWTTL